MSKSHIQSTPGIEQLKKQLAAAQWNNLIALQMGIHLDTATTSALQRQIDQYSAKQKKPDWLSDTLTKARSPATDPIYTGSSVHAFHWATKSPQVPAGLAIQSANKSSYKAPGLPDFDAMKETAIAEAMKQVDRAVALNQVDRQRVKDAVVAHVQFGKLDSKAFRHIMQSAKAGSSEIAALAGPVASASFSDRTSLRDLMRELDANFGRDKAYWDNRDAVKRAVSGGLTAAGLSPDETYRIALKSLGRNGQLSKLNLADKSAAYNAARWRELQSTNPNYVGGDSQAFQFAKNEHGETPDEYGARRFSEKARSGANPIKNAVQAANFDLLDLIPGLVHRVPIAAYAVGTGFGQTPEMYKAATAKLNNSPALDQLTERLPGIGTIAQGAGMLSSALKGAEGLWDGGSQEGYKLSSKPTGPYGWGENALEEINSFLSLKDAATLLYNGGRGFLKIAEESARRHVHEPTGVPGDDFPFNARPEATPEQINIAKGSLQDLDAAHQKGGYWQYIKGLGIKKILTSGRGAQLVGMKVRDVRDLAIAAQMLRDPRFEVLRYFFVKDGKIVDHSAYSSRLAAGSGVFTPIGDETFKDWLEEKIRESHADGYYVLHNHPSGLAHVSEKDIEMTNSLPHKEYFKGHVVIDSNQYGLIMPSEKVYHELPFSFHEGRDELLTPQKPHSALGHGVKGPHDLLKVGVDLKTKDGFVTIVGVGKDESVRAIAEVPETELLGTKAQQRKGIGIVRGVAHQSGSVWNYVVVPSARFKNLSDEELRQIRIALETNVVTDVVDQSGRSMAEIMKIPRDGKENLGPYQRTKRWH